MDGATFSAWYRRHKPDVVIGHFDECLGWLRKLRRRVPGDVGFFNLNWVARVRPLCGIDPRLDEQGVVRRRRSSRNFSAANRGLPAIHARGTCRGASSRVRRSGGEKNPHEKIFAGVK